MRATALYRHNICMSQALYPLISILEVSLRNAIDVRMRIHFNSSNWILAQKKDFFIDPNLTYFDKRDQKTKPDTFFSDKIFAVETRMKMANAMVIHNKVIADLSLHFWTKFFDEKPVKVLKGVQMSVFKNNPGLKAKEIHALLNEIRHIRNRISHSEPICFNKHGQLCLKYALQKYRQVIEVIRWIDSDLLQWTSGFDCFLSVSKNML